MRYRDLIEPCALELVIHQICSKLCLPRLFLFRAVNATWGHGNFSAGHISAFNLCFSRIYAYIGQRNGDRTLKNMTPQPDSSSSASVPSLKHRRKSSLQVLPKLDFREDFEKYRKKLLQPWNFHSIYTRC